MSRVEVRLLGRFAVVVDGEEVPTGAFQGRLVQTLIRILVTRRGQFVSRDVLIEALWPTEAPADPARNLNVLVTRARRALGDPALIVTGPGGYSFAAAAGCTVDAETFLDLLRRGRPQEALTMWGGEPLAEDAYDDWAAEYRSRLAQAHLEALEAAASAALALGEPARAVTWARLAVAREPLREAGHLLVARALAASRDTAAALETLAQLRRRLADELGLDPSSGAQALEAAILRGADVSLAPAAGAPGPGAIVFGELPFLGRDEELARILASPDAIAVVAGLPGSGKSRLLAEVAARAGRRVIAARAAPSERDEPWLVARGLVLAALAREPPVATAGAAAPAGLDALAELGLPELAAPPGATSSAELDVKTRRALAIEAAVRLIDAVGTPGLLTVDDLQWADPSSLALVERIAARLPAVQIVLALRPEEVAPGESVARLLERIEGLGRPVVHISLGPLPASALQAAIGDPKLVEILVAEAEAFPMAVAEVVRKLAADGAIVPGTDGRWIASDDRSYERARESARRGQQAAIEARLARHPRRRSELVRLLALGGRPLPARLLARATGSAPEEVLADLDALGESGLVRAGREGWTPAHDLIADAALARLSPTARARLHELLATALRESGADPSEVGRHLAGAGDAGGAAEALAEAATQRLRRFAHREAEAVAEAGLALAPTGRTASALLEVRAEARVRTGDLTGARSDLRGALAGTAPGPRRSHLLARMAMLTSGAEDLVRAGELADLAIAEAGTDARARAEALWVASVVDMNAGRQDQAASRSGEALELFRQAGDARGIADVLDARAMATFMSGDIRAAVGAFDRVARLFEDSGDLLRAGTPRSTRGHALTFMDRSEEGLADTGQALELARSLGHAEGEAYALWHRAEALAGLGRGEEALASAGEALAIAERLGHREWTAASLRGVGIAHQALGDLAAAEAAFARSLAASEHLGLFAAWAAARMAQVRVAVGDPAAAAPLVARALAEGPAISWYEARLAGAEAAVALGDPEAPRLVAEALALAERGGHLVGARRLADLEKEL